MTVEHRCRPLSFHAKEIDMHQRSASQRPVDIRTVVTDQQADYMQTLSSPSASIFLGFVLNGGGGHLDPGVKAAIQTTKEALSDVGVSWKELPEALRQGRWTAGGKK